jgi:methylated-DNA-protein-cysteine methyltransferase-like protein
MPWHRVVNSAGKISLRGGDGPATQARRLRREGVAVSLAGRVDLRERRWMPRA